MTFKSLISFFSNPPETELSTTAGNRIPHKIEKNKNETRGKNFLAIFSAALFALFLMSAPQMAEAQTRTGTPNPSPVPTATGMGAFDCLGEYDWGCRILSFLFEEKDNQVVYTTYIHADGST